MEEGKKKILYKKLKVICHVLAVVLLTIFCLVLHDYCMTNFPLCPETECPYRYFFEDINMWRSEEKLIMSDIQAGLRNIWLIGLDLLTPDETSTSLGDILGALNHQKQKLHKIWSKITTWIARRNKTKQSPIMETIELSEPTATNHRNNNNVITTTATKIMVTNNIFEDSGLSEDLDMDSSREQTPLPGFV